MTHIEVFDPPTCCSTGVCGQGIDPLLAAFAADVEWLSAQGVTVVRHNLSQDPQPSPNPYCLHGGARKPSIFASWRRTESAPPSKRGVPMFSRAIRLVREVCHGSRDHIVTVFRNDHSCLVTQAAECL